MWYRQEEVILQMASPYVVKGRAKSYSGGQRLPGVATSEHSYRLQPAGGLRFVATMFGTT